MSMNMIELVEGAARARNDPPVERAFIQQALAQIESGAAEVDRYPAGKPTLRAVYLLASQLEAQGKERQ